MSRHGTRRSTILKRRTAGAERVILFLKRFGLALVACGVLAGAGAWLVSSGTLDRARHSVEDAAMGWLAERGYRVENILVDGRIHTDVDTLKAMVNVRRGDPVFAFRPREAQAMIEKLSWVKNAHIERRLPDTIYIRLEERTPVALWQRNRRLSVIDAEGVVLTSEGLEDFRNLLIVVGDDAPAQAAGLLTMLRAEPLIVERVEAATLIGGRRWDLRLKSGADVRLPEDGLGLALRRLAVNHEEEGILDKNVLSIDVREEGRITVRTKPGAVQDFKAGSLTPQPATGDPI